MFSWYITLGCDPQTCHHIKTELPVSVLTHQYHFAKLLIRTNCRVVYKLLEAFSKGFWYPKFPRLLQPLSGNSKEGINILMTVP